MKALILKDLRIGFRFLILIFVIFLLHAPANFRDMGGFLFLSCLFSILLMGGTTFIDWHYETAALYGSFPVSRKNQVLARYLSAGLGLLSATVIIFSYTAFLDQWIAPNLDSASGFLNVDSLLGFVLLMTFLFSIFFPFYFRWGIVGAWLALGSTLLILLFFAHFFTGFTFSGFGDSRGPLLSDAEAWLVGIFKWAKTVFPGMAVYPLSVFCGFLLVGSSFMNSVRIYAGRDL